MRIKPHLNGALLYVCQISLTSRFQPKPSHFVSLHDTFRFCDYTRGRIINDYTPNGAHGIKYNNYLNKVSGTEFINYSYLANGFKTSSLIHGIEDTRGLIYRGPFIFRQKPDRTWGIESVEVAEGKLTDGVALIYLKDHLGSVTKVVNANTGEVVESSDYTSYGKRASSTSTEYGDKFTGVTLRAHFTGKEDQKADFNVDYTDFGARHYSPVLRRWLTPDPLSEKYYGISPYAYCSGNPVNYVDPDGRHIVVKDLGNNTYEIIGGELNDDNNIYVNYGTPDQQIIGTSLTPYSFFGENESVITGAVINLNDNSGQMFLEDIMTNTPPLLSYMVNAFHWEDYDFKVNGIEKGQLSDDELTKYIYRGMPIKLDNTTSIFSGRDVGNFAAGYVSRKKGLPWWLARLGFDAYQFTQTPLNPKEGKTTQLAEYAGYTYKTK